MNAEILWKNGDIKILAINPIWEDYLSRKLEEL